jgi:DNA-binding transcriptional LysR family regulator
MLYLTLRQIEYIVAIADAGSFVQAAQNVNVSQPALSVAVAQVEDRIGRTLFRRKRGTPLAVTPWAKVFVDDARKLLADAARLEDPDLLSKRQQGQITLGCFEDLAPRYLAPVLSHLATTYPELVVNHRVTRFDDLARGALEGQIDLAITYDLGLDASFERVELARVHPHAYFSPNDPIAAFSAIRLSDLASRPLIAFDEGQSNRHLLNLFKVEGLAPRIAARVASLELMRSLAAHEIGVGISYTHAPGDRSYDGRTVLARPIVDETAVEPIILARVAGIAPMSPVPEVIKSIKSLPIWQSRGEAR